MKISIIIVNYNVKYFLEQCLQSVINASTNIEAEILVVDNQSTDGSREYFSGRFGKVDFTWNIENMGFGKANNLALKKATGEYILFLNPDTILPEDCLEKCLDFLEDKKEAGALGIRMVDGSGAFLKESKRGLPSPFTSFCKLSGLTALFPASGLFARYYLGHLDQYKNHEVDVIAGAFMLARKIILDKTGGFDERFFMYGEDVDLSYRIQKAGYNNYYFSGSTIVHFKGESTQKDSLNYVRLFYGAMSLFVEKHYSSGIARFYKILIQPAIGIKALISGAGHLIRYLFTDRQEGNSTVPCLIIANKKEFDAISTILQISHAQQEILGRISPHHLTEEDAAGNLTALPGLLPGLPAKEIIFCMNGWPAKEMISLIQQLPSGLHFRFHFTGTHGIVGSRHN